MTDATQTILLVDSDPLTRATLARQLEQAGRLVLEAADGQSALQIVQTRNVGLVVTELYLPTNDSDCLVQAMRQHRVRGVRSLALTSHAAKADRQWAKRWGASAFLIRPAAPDRVQYVVTRLLTMTATGNATREIARRDTLDRALGEIERGELHGMLSIVFGRPWWDDLAETERSAFRQRARRARVSLRSDAKMSRTFVELRGGRGPGAETTKASPYRA